MFDAGVSFGLEDFEIMFQKDQTAREFKVRNSMIFDMSVEGGFADVEKFSGFFDPH